VGVVAEEEEVGCLTSGRAGSGGKFAANKFVAAMTSNGTERKINF
jgi:hypothetical protein